MPLDMSKRGRGSQNATRETISSFVLHAPARRLGSEAQWRTNATSTRGLPKEPASAGFRKRRRDRGGQDGRDRGAQAVADDAQCSPGRPTPRRR